MTHPVKDYHIFKSKLKEAIERERPIKLISYTVSEDVELKSEAIVHSILDRYNKLPLKPLLYTVLKELLSNGTKANLKRIHFMDMGLNIENPEDYVKGMESYRKTINELDARFLGSKAKEHNICIETIFRFSEDGIRINVVNFSTIVPKEEARLRSRLSEIMKHNTVLDFFVNHYDEEEGSGLGLAMITTLLRAENIDPDLFRIFSDELMTTARLEIPFTESFLSTRTPLRLPSFSTSG